MEKVMGGVMVEEVKEEVMEMVVREVGTILWWG